MLTWTLVNSTIDLEKTTEEYFRECLLEALGRLRLQLAAWTEFYLVDLLARKAPRIPFQTPLVLQYKAAVEETQPLGRFVHFQATGDTALLLLGYFGDYVYSRALSPSYVRHMGAGAYSAAAGMAAAFDGLTAAYEDLSSGFEEISLVINEVKEMTVHRTPNDVARMYEALNLTKSPSVAERLRQAGLFVASGSEDN